MNKAYDNIGVGLRRRVEPSSEQCGPHGRPGIRGMLVGSSGFKLSALDAAYEFQ